MRHELFGGAGRPAGPTMIHLCINAKADMVFDVAGGGKDRWSREDGVGARTHRVKILDVQA